jgi:hypothetical protein
MKLQLQLGLLVALGISALGLPCAAQNRNANRPPQQPKVAARQAPRQERRQQQGSQRAQGGRPNAERPYNNTPVNRPIESPGARNEGNRPPNAGSGTGQRPNLNPNRPPNATVRSRDLSPQERQNLDKFNRLPPQERQEIRDRLRQWQKLTPEQQSHIKNDLSPKWQQMSPDRQKAIRQRLGVLQNMPESARNQHLNDPNFTRGMTEEDRAMLRDLSHMHVGAPDPPNE